MNRSRWTSIVKAIIVISILVSLGFFISRTNWSQVLTLLSDLPGAFVLVVLFSFISYTLGAVSWYLCIGQPWRWDLFKDVWMLRNVAEMVTIFNPSNIIVGDGLKIVYLQRFGIDKSDTTNSVVISRLLLILSAITLMLICGYKLIVPLLDQYTIHWPWIAALTLIGIYLALRLLLKQLSHLKWVQKVITALSTLRVYAQTHQSQIFWAYIAAVAHWIFGAMEVWVILNAVGMEISIINAVYFEMGVQALKSLGFMVPGQLGVEEYANNILMHSLGLYDANVWLVLSLMRRGRQLVWVLLAAGLFYKIKHKVKLIQA